MILLMEYVMILFVPLWLFYRQCFIFVHVGIKTLQEEEWKIKSRSLSDKTCKTVTDEFFPIAL